MAFAAVLLAGCNTSGPTRFGQVGPAPEARSNPEAASRNYVRQTERNRAEDLEDVDSD
jgi:hypothetical protein